MPGLREKEGISDMNRRSWMRWLPAALLPWVAKGQTSAEYCTKDQIVDAARKGVHLAGCPAPQIEWKRGKPLNNQCPVCGTMAKPYLRKTYFEEYGHLIGTLPPIKSGRWGALCDHANLWKRMEEDDAIKRPNEMIGPDHMDVRCVRCNCKFVQDANR